MHVWGKLQAQKSSEKTLNLPQRLILGKTVAYNSQRIRSSKESANPGAVGKFPFQTYILYSNVQCPTTTTSHEACKETGKSGALKETITTKTVSQKKTDGKL